MVLPIDRAKYCRRNVRDAAEHARQMVIAENRRSIATAGAQLVFRDLLGAWRFTMRSFHLLRGKSVGQRVKVQPRVSAIRLWTNRSISILVDTAKPTFRLEIIVGICGARKMLRDDADLGTAARNRKFYDLFAPSKVRH